MKRNGAHYEFVYCNLSKKINRLCDMCFISLDLEFRKLRHWYGNNVVTFSGCSNEMFGSHVVSYTMDRFMTSLSTRPDERRKEWRIRTSGDGDEV